MVHCFRENRKQFENTKQILDILEFVFQEVNMEFKKIENIEHLNNKVKGQGCDDDCTETNILCGRRDPNTSGCVYYDEVYTPRVSTFN